MLRTLLHIPCYMKGVIQVYQHASIQVHNVYITKVLCAYLPHIKGSHEIVAPGSEHLLFFF